MTRETWVQLSREMALALPMTRTVVLVQREMRMEWVMEARISTMPSGGLPSKFSMSHLLLSNSFRGGFLVRMFSGFLPGSGDFPREERLFWLSERTGAEGTALPARREGFLWVCEEGSTLRSLEVTASPLEISSKTAPISLEPLEVERPLGGIGGGGGALSNFGRGGGGGGPPLAED